MSDTISSSIDSIQIQNNFFDDEIKQYAEDSIRLSLDGKKAFLYGKARIEYQNTNISASYIEIDRNKVPNASQSLKETDMNNSTATTIVDLLGEKLTGVTIKDVQNSPFQKNLD